MLKPLACLCSRNTPPIPFRGKHNGSKLLSPPEARRLTEIQPKRLKKALLADHRPTDYRGDVWCLTKRDAGLRRNDSEGDSSFVSQEWAANIAGMDRADFLLALSSMGRDSFAVDFKDLDNELARG